MSAEFVPSVIISDYLDYESARKHICIRVINYNHNHELVKDLPHVVREDLAVIFYYMPPSGGEDAQKNGRGTQSEAAGTVLRNRGCRSGTAARDTHCRDTALRGPEQDVAGPQSGEREPEPGEAILASSHRIVGMDLKNWGIDIDRLYRDALLSSREIHPAFLAPMRQILGLPQETEKGEIPMYVLSCRDARYGASVMFYPEVLRVIAEGLQDCLYIIPSSIHELILLREQDVEDTGGLVRMIREINRTEVLPGDVLSDHLYYYDKERDLLGCVVDDSLRI